MCSGFSLFLFTVLSGWMSDCVFLFSQLKEEQSVFGSDEEVDDPPEVDSDEDLSDDGNKQIHEEVRIEILILDLSLI